MNEIRLTPEASGNPPAAASPALTVYFDGACPVCSREIAAYRGQPGAERCTWVDASRCADAELGDGLTRAAALARLHVRHADGSLSGGVQGFAALWATLPRTAWLGRLAGWAPVTALLEVAYSGFLRLRKLWRPEILSTAWPAAVTADLRSDHAGEVGAVQIYRGILAVSRDPAVRDFASRHLATEESHLACIERHLPSAQHSRLLPAWRVAGWMTGALPALVGPRAVYETVAAVERFVDQHYAGQIVHLDQLLGDQEHIGAEQVAARASLRALRDELAACREDELHHRDEAMAAAAVAGRGPHGSPQEALTTAETGRSLQAGAGIRAWAAAVGSGSAFAVALARRI